MRVSWKDLPSGSESKEGPDHIIRMEVKNIAAFQTEDFMPPANELKSRVDFIYSNDLPERDQENFWKKVGKNRNNQLESFVGKHKAMEEALAQIVAPTDPQEVKLRKIYDRVQQIRNTTYELRKTAQEEKREKEKVAENVEDVWKRGYGTGMQLTWLYLALVRAAGFEAYGVWVSDRRNYFFHSEDHAKRNAGCQCGAGQIERKGSLLRPRSGVYPLWPFDLVGNRSHRIASGQRLRSVDSNRSSGKF